MRVVTASQACIGYRLNILGIRVYRDYCQLVGRSGNEWVTIGPPRALPVEIPSDIREVSGDPLLMTAYQYDQECPGTDLRDVLARRTDFDAALSNTCGRVSAS